MRRIIDFFYAVGFFLEFLLYFIGGTIALIVFGIISLIINPFRD